MWSGSGRPSDGEAAPQVLRDGIAEIQRELEVSPEFPAEVQAAAEAAAANPRLPDLDRTDLPLVTIDPAGARTSTRRCTSRATGAGYVLHYAIADLAAFITPGDPVDVEAHKRGQTLYGADSRVPLHPTALSEGGGSLLPDQVRPSLLWTITHGRRGRGDRRPGRAGTWCAPARSSTTRACSRPIDDGSADESLMPLREVGELRLKREQARGGVSLPLPEQEVDTAGSEWAAHYRDLLPVEEWNAQMSLLTGFAAASLMMYARVGFLRTLPPPHPRDLQRLHRTAHALGVEWPAELIFADFIRGLDASKPQHAAMISACTRLLRGSGYVAFDGETPAQPLHSALNAEYAHVTAPLRRLGDRYASEVCVALCAGEEVRAGCTRRCPAGQGDAGVLAAGQQLRADGARPGRGGTAPQRVGESFAAVVVDVNEKEPTRGTVTVADPAVEAPVVSATELPLGTDVRARLTTADVARRKVEFTLE